MVKNMRELKTFEIDKDGKCKLIAELWREPELKSEKILEEMFPKKLYQNQRDAYGKVLKEIGEKDKRIVALSADLAGSTKVQDFGNIFKDDKNGPSRFFNMGVAEQNMMDFAAGLSAVGLIPFVSTFSIFATGRAWEQVRQGICYNNFNVKIVSTHGGITVGEDGATHQANEDISIMLPIPDIKIVIPADAHETRQVIRAAVDTFGPFYVRLSRSPCPSVFDDSYKYEFPKAKVMKNGKDCVIFACGIMLAHSLCAAKMLEEEGISASVVNVSTIKPLDIDTVVEQARKTGCAVTAEESSIIGGLGSIICSVLAEEYPVPVKRVGIRDIFGMSGSAQALLKYYGLMPEDIASAVKESIRKKRKN